ncbi:hypothetical protein ACWIG5_04425 [Streptomyces lydicus]
MTTQSPAPTVPAQQAPAAQQPVPPAVPQPSSAAQPDSTLRILVIGLVIAVLGLMAAGAFYVSLEHPSVAAPLQAMGSVLGAVGTVTTFAVLGRRR